MNCAKCETPGRLLVNVSGTAYVNYFRCDKCGLVWTCDKEKQNVVAIVAAPKEPEPPARAPS